MLSPITGRHSRMRCSLHFNDSWFLFLAAALRCRRCEIFSRGLACNLFDSRHGATALRCVIALVRDFPSQPLHVTFLFLAATIRRGVTALRDIFFCSPLRATCIHDFYLSPRRSGATLRFCPPFAGIARLSFAAFACNLIEQSWTTSRFH